MSDRDREGRDGGGVGSREAEVRRVVSELTDQGEAVVERLAPRPGKADVYVVHGAGSAPALVAKLQDEETSLVEQRAYGLLGRLPVSSIHCYGVVPAIDTSLAWLVTEYSSGDPFTPSAHEHRSALAGWLGAMHLEARRLSAPGGLPDHGSEYWRAVVSEAVRTLGCGLSNNQMLPAQRRPLAALATIFDRMLDDWRLVETLMADIPATLTHGDLVPQNVRVATRSGGLAPMVHDWGQAGWGSPLVDLPWVDPEVYLGTVGADDVVRSAPVARRLQALGTAMWTAFVLQGERPNFQSLWPHRAADKVPAYLNELQRRDVAALWANGAGT